MRAAMPSPRAMPLTSCVLPAPKSPVRPMTQPALASRPHRSPSAAVSSGLCEMNVTMSGHRQVAVLVAEFNASGGDDLPDAGQRHIGELFLPRVEQRDSVAAGDGEQEFKVLTVGERGEQRRFGGGFGFGLQLRGAADGDGALQ